MTNIKYKTITVEELYERKQDIGIRYDRVFILTAKGYREILDIDPDEDGLENLYKVFISGDEEETVAGIMLHDRKVLCTWAPKKYYAVRGVHDISGDPVYPSSYDRVDPIYRSPNSDDVENIIEDLMNVWWEEPYDVEPYHDIDLHFDFLDGEPDRFKFSSIRDAFFETLDAYGAVDLMDILMDDTGQLHSKIWLEQISDQDVQDNWELWEDAIQ